MNDRFKRALTVSTAVHVGIIVLVAIAPLFLRLLRPRKPKEMITFIDLMPALPPPPPEPEQPKPDIAEPRPKATESTPVAERPKIKINTNKIVRRDAPKSQTPPKATLTKEQIKKILDSGVKFTSSPGAPPGEFSDLALYYAIVQQAMYGAWQQPATVAKGVSAEVALRIARNGAVLQRRMTRGSGNSLMDESVMRAVESVSRLKPLPPEIGGPHLDVTVEFVIGDGF